MLTLSWLSRSVSFRVRPKKRYDLQERRNKERLNDKMDMMNQLKEDLNTKRTDVTVEILGREAILWVGIFHKLVGVEKTPMNILTVLTLTLIKT